VPLAESVENDPRRLGIYLPFTDDVKEVNVLLAKEMAKQGIAIDVSKL
jgi:hypothetical protein